jgi:hypothetical protein
MTGFYLKNIACNKNKCFGSKNKRFIGKKNEV